MAFKDFAPEQQQGIELLQRSLARGRLGHAYLFSGQSLDDLEPIARTLAKTLNCSHPVKREGIAVDCCDACDLCLKIEAGAHPDVHWVRPESKSRIISVDQVRELMREIQLKPAQATYKVATLIAADRLKTEGANAFLKTLEEPPARSVLILVSTEPQRLLETIVSRCLRLQFASDSARKWDPAQTELLEAFSAIAGQEQKSLLSRYRLLDVLLAKLAVIRETIETALTERSPMTLHKDADKNLQEKWEDELKAAIEAEYRRQRGTLLLALQYWFRDIWLQTLKKIPRNEATGLSASPASTDIGGELLNFPNLAVTPKVASRLNWKQAGENLQIIELIQRRLHTNVQEALALEIGLLKLHL
jgi:DNA polymerase-3 subunit delta'